MSTQRTPADPWISRLALGRMPLWLAWIFGIGINVGTAQWLVLAAAGTAYDQFIFFTWLFGPVLLVPLVARIKRRRFYVWAFLSTMAVLFGFVQPFFQPMAVLAALVFAQRIANRRPERELEAQEDSRAMQRLLAIREELWPIYQHAEDRYMHRDYATLTSYTHTLDTIENHLKGVREQKSERGQRVRLHLNAAIQELRIVGGEAEAVLSMTSDSPELAALAGQGGSMPTHGKPARALAKHIRKIEQMLNHARVQIGVAGGILEALGYTPDAHPSVGPDTQGDPEPVADGAYEEDRPLPPPPTASGPRPRRPVRRRRH